MSEYTMIGYDSAGHWCEVMVNVSPSGKIQDVYTYLKELPVLFNEETGKEYKNPFKEGKNPLFVHFSCKVLMIKLLNRIGFFFSNEDECRGDIEFNKMVALYSLTSGEHAGTN